MQAINKLHKFSNPRVRPLWRHAWAAKEDALRTCTARTMESLKAHSKPLHPLSIGERVFLQNQQGHHPTKWIRSGTVVDSTGHDQYKVKVDGSGHLTLCKRHFLPAYTPATPSFSQEPTTAPHLTGIGEHLPHPHPRAPEPHSNMLPQAAEASPTVDAPTTEDPSPTDHPSTLVLTPTSPAQVLTDYLCPGGSSAPGSLTPEVPPHTPAPDKQSCPSIMNRKRESG